MVIFVKRLIVDRSSLERLRQVFEIRVSILITAYIFIVIVHMVKIGEAAPARLGRG
ncbi:hypothetical protein D3C72_2510950 [compost metagenome]